MLRLRKWLHAMYFRRWLALAAVVAGGLPVVQAGDGYSVNDKFTLGNQQRKEADVLNGESAESSNANWKAQPGMKLAASPDGGKLSLTTEKSLAAMVPVPADAVKLRLEADASVDGAKAWLGLGFSGSGDTGICSWSGGAFVLIDSGGWARVFANGTKIKVGMKKVADFKLGAPQRLKVEYDRKANTLSAWCGELELVKDYALDKDTFRPGMLYAGVSSFGAGPQAWFDNFSLSCTQDATAAKQAAQKPANTLRILYMGNSITRSYPSEKIKWSITAGMAASSEANDFAHRLAALIAGEKKDQKVEPVFLAHGGGVVTSFGGRVSEYKDLQPDVVVIQLGENDRQEMGEAGFASAYETILKDVKSLSPAPLILCTGIWNPGNGGEYAGWAKTIEGTIQRLAEREGAVFVPVAAAARDPKNRGTGETEGVRWHPNDEGMKAYAEALFSAWKKAQSAR